jgi:hypothetical protein
MERLTMGSDKGGMAVGKTVFLTCEEAEATLKGEKDG